MKSLRIQLDEGTEQEFREKAMQLYGYSKGALSKAAEVALEDWANKIEIPSLKQKGKEPVDAIEGLMSSINKDSLELQHATLKIWEQGLQKLAEKSGKRK